MLKLKAKFDVFHHSLLKHKNKPPGRVEWRLYSYSTGGGLLLPTYKFRFFTIARLNESDFVAL